MFYRLKFDGVVGGILKQCKYDTAASLNFWPTGATPEWVEVGKRDGLRPFEAAAIGVSEVALGRLRASQFKAADAKLIVYAAMRLAFELKASPVVLAHLHKIAAEVDESALVETGRENPKPRPTLQPMTESQAPGSSQNLPHKEQTDVSSVGQSTAFAGHHQSPSAESMSRPWTLDKTSGILKKATSRKEYTKSEWKWIDGEVRSGILIPAEKHLWIDAREIEMIQPGESATPQRGESATPLPSELSKPRPATKRPDSSGGSQNVEAAEALIKALDYYDSVSILGPTEFFDATNILKQVSERVLRTTPKVQANARPLEAATLLVHGIRSWQYGQRGGQPGKKPHEYLTEGIQAAKSILKS